MDWLSEPAAWMALLSLTFLETILGIDNIVFLSILTGRLPEHERAKARRIGLLLAMAMRIGLLFAISWVVGLTQTLFAIGDYDVTGRGIILLVGGLFLMWKSVTEIHDKLEGAHQQAAVGAGKATFAGVLVQVALLDTVFSLDSVITAVGMAERVSVMVIAIVVSVAIMALFVGPICGFVERRPTVKMLALSFLLLIGFTLVAEGIGLHIPKGYIYFAMAFSIAVELLNLRLRPDRG
ncbi:MAG: TerC family protein [Planctomycetes bacterium]|nr:TerC family protein [Planctomycetota bacterium]